MEAHVSNTVHANIHQLCSVKRSLTLDSRRTLATAFVASRIDYCNSVLCTFNAKSTAESPQSSVMSSTGSLYSFESESDTKSPYWLRTVFTASAQLIFHDICAPVTDAPGRTNLRSSKSFDLSNTNKIGLLAEFPYICTLGVELTFRIRYKP